MDKKQGKQQNPPSAIRRGDWVIKFGNDFKKQFKVNKQFAQDLSGRKLFRLSGDIPKLCAVGNEHLHSMNMFLHREGTHYVCPLLDWSACAELYSR